MQTQHDKLKAELEQAEAQNRLLQMRSSEQLAAAERVTRDREAELEAALKRAKEEAAQALVRLQAEHQAALEAAAAQKLDNEVRCLGEPAWTGFAPRCTLEAERVLQRCWQQSGWSELASVRVWLKSNRPPAFSAVHSRASNMAVASHVSGRRFPAGRCKCAGY